MAIADDFTIYSNPSVNFDYVKGLWENEEQQDLIDLSGLGTPEELETAVEVQRKLAKANRGYPYGYPKEPLTSYEFVIMDFKTNNKKWTL